MFSLNISASFPSHSRCSGFLTKPSFPFFPLSISHHYLYFSLVRTFQLQTSGQTMPLDAAKQFHTFFKIQLQQHDLHEVFTNTFRLTKALNSGAGGLLYLPEDKIDPKSHTRHVCPCLKSLSKLYTNALI